MAKKNVRQMKVYGQSGYRYEETPTIMLIITLDEEKTKMVEAENAFMERETKALRKCFEQEKAKLHQQFVAEGGAGYVADKGIVD